MASLSWQQAVSLLAVALVLASAGLTHGQRRNLQSPDEIYQRIERLSLATLKLMYQRAASWPELSRCVNFWQHLDAAIAGRTLEPGQIYGSREAMNKAGLANAGVIHLFADWLRATNSDQNLFYFVDLCTQMLSVNGASMNPYVAQAEPSVTELAATVASQSQELARLRAQLDEQLRVALTTREMLLSEKTNVKQLEFKLEEEQDKWASEKSLLANEHSRELQQVKTDMEERLERAQATIEQMLTLQGQLKEQLEVANRRLEEMQQSRPATDTPESEGPHESSAAHKMVLKD